MYDKHRFEIWTPAQHPLKHSLSDFSYVNAALPGVTDVNAALNYFVKVLFPNTKPAVATPAALPLTGNALHDYRVVQDDGDGKQAGYRWEQREGDVAPLWYKVFDFEWSTDSIISGFVNVTQDLYVYKGGKSDLDSTGAAITGIYAGQTVIGGNVANQNLTLLANSGDGAGAHTGFVQVDDNFRPTITGTYDLGTSAILFRNLYLSGSAAISTMTITGGSILDTSGAISFGAVNLLTTGTIGGGVITGTSFKSGTMTITGGSITDSSGALSFGSANLTTTGKITTASGSVLGNLTFTTGSIASGSGAITFGSANLTTTGTISGGTITGTQVNAGNVQLSGNTVSITNAGGALNLQANGAGVVNVASAMTTLGQTITGSLSATGQVAAGNLALTGNVLSSTNANGNITLTPNGAGIIQTSSSIIPGLDNASALGSSSLRFKDLFLSGTISDGTTSISQSVLQSFRAANTAVSPGMTLFWDGSKWSPSIPDTEITHSTLSGLVTGDAGHTQFVMLTGRAGGQIVQGGTALSENLILESTANATKGLVKTKDTFASFTAPVYSAGWTGTDLGAVSSEFRNLYTKGELIGARLENKTSGALPSASAQNVGRAVWATDVNKIYIDVGGSWIVAGVGKYLSDTVWNGSQTTQTFTVSASIVDARNAIWMLHDNTNNFEQIYCTITKPSATQVQVTVSPALPAGSYRLIGIE